MSREHVDQIKRQMAEHDASLRDRLDARDPDTRLDMPTWQREHLARMVAAGHVDVDKLSPVGGRVLRWLAGWDNFTIVGIEELFAKIHDAGKAAGS